MAHVMEGCSLPMFPVEVINMVRVCTEHYGLFFYESRRVQS